MEWIFLFCGSWLVVAFVSFLIVKKNIDIAPIGWEDKDGFHYGRKEK